MAADDGAVANHGQRRLGIRRHVDLEVRLADGRNFPGSMAGLDKAFEFRELGGKARFIVLI